MITSVIRICAVVGMSAVTLISSLLRSKNDNGPINQYPFNNSNPYSCNSGDDTMFNNAYGSQSRRFYNGYAQQPVMAPMGYPAPMQVQPYQQRPLTFGPSQLMPSPQLQATLAQYGYPTPGFNNAGYQNMGMGYQPSYTPNMYGNYPTSGYSRRNMNGYNPFTQPQSMNNYGMSQQMDMTNGIYREPTSIDPAVQALYGNYQSCNYGYGYSGNTPNYSQMNQGFNWGTYQQPQPQQQQFQQNYSSQPMSLGSYNGIIGSAARYKYWSPSTSYGTGVTYYGYDENCPAYPPPTASDIREMQMAQQMTVRPIPQPQPQPQQPMMQRPMPFDPQQMFGNRMRPVMNVQPQPQTQQPQPQQPMPGQVEFEKMMMQKYASSNLTNDIPSMGDIDNAWYSVNELNTAQATPQSNIVPPPSPQTQQGPVTPLTQMVPPPSQPVQQPQTTQEAQVPADDTELSIDAILALGRPNIQNAPDPGNAQINTSGPLRGPVVMTRAEPIHFMI